MEENKDNKSIEEKQEWQKPEIVTLGKNRTEGGSEFGSEDFSTAPPSL